MFIDDNRRWAVIGYDRNNFSEEFIATHPMDFYESEDQIKGNYKVYLMNEHAGYAPRLEYRGDNSVGFKSSLSFMELAPNYGGEEDFRLKHLRMLMGTEDEPFWQIDFADLWSYIGDRDITIDAAIFSEEDSVNTIIKWIKDTGKKHSIQNHNLVIVMEGTDIIKGDNLITEVPKLLGIEVEHLAFYFDETESSQINISLLWYEAVAEVRGLRENWGKYYEDKLLYASGDKAFDMDDYCELVRKTWQYISYIKIRVEYLLDKDSAYVEVERKYLLGFYEYMKLIKVITYYSVLLGEDKSKDYMFTVTALLADELTRLATEKKTGVPQYNYKGELMGFGGTIMEVTGEVASSNNREQILYKIEDKNYQVLLELAKRINEK